MPIIRIKKDNNYSIINNKIIEDKRLSWGATGLLTYLLHLPNDWKIYIADLKNRKANGRDSASSKIKELIKFGYIVRNKKRDEKQKFNGYEYTVYENPYTENPYTENPKIDNTNKLNTNNINSIIKNNITDSKESDNLSIEKELDRKLNTKVNDLLKIIASTGNFKTRFPVNGDKPSKTLIKAQNYLWAFKEARLDVDNSFDQKWVKRNNINFNFKYETWDDMIKDCKRAARRYTKMKEEDFYPADKNKLTGNIADFIYNPYTKNSWFMYCLFNTPKTIKQTNSETLNKNIFPDDEYGVKSLSKAKEIIDNEKWNGFSYWQKIKEMYEWYNKYKDALHVYNQGLWINEFSDFYDLLVNLEEFIKYWREEGLEYTIGHFGYNNKTWLHFVKWVKKNKGVNLKPDKDELLNVIDYSERNGRMVDNSEIIREELKWRENIIRL